MSDVTPKVSVIIATYSPREGLDRVISSLDAQSMPQEEFEAIFVDDGSPDDTHQRLQRLAQTRPNMHVHRIENSGWPSRPRNIGIEAARGEYLVFMDHDDSLYPDGLRSAYEFAKANNSDVVSPKESKTNDSWWWMSFPTDHNIADVRQHRGIKNLMPMVPHKMYSRKLLIDNRIRFPEGSRVLWEDAFMNVDAYAHADRVSVLADSPFYIWQVHDSNTTQTFDPAGEDFYDRLEDLMKHIKTALADQRFAQDRAYLLAHQMAGRVIDSTVRLVRQGDSREARRAVRRARALVHSYLDDDVQAALSPKHRVQARLLLTGHPELTKQVHATDLKLSGSVTATHVQWAGGCLELAVTARLSDRTPGAPGMRLVDGRAMLAVPSTVERIVGRELLDFTDAIESYDTMIVVRSRSGYLTWNVPMTRAQARYETDAEGGLAMVWVGTGVLDLRRGAVDQPVPEGVYDFRTRWAYAGMVRKGGLRAPSVVLPSLVDGRPAVAYRSAKDELALDLTQSKRTAAIDGWPRRGSGGTTGNLDVVLEAMSVSADGSAEAHLAAVPETWEGVAPVEQSIAHQESAGMGLSARIVAVGGVARLQGTADLSAGTYRLHARREGEWHRTARGLVVDDSGNVTVI